MQSLILKLASSFGGCVTVYGAVYICFRIAEKFSTPRLKQELTNAIITSSLFTIGSSLPRLFTSIFDAVFTENLWSLRGFFRSTLASIVTVIILIIFWSSSVPDDWHIRISVLDQADHPGVRTWFLIASRSPQGMEMGRHGEIIGASPNASLAFQWLPLHMLVFGPFIYNLLADYSFDCHEANNREFVAAAKFNDRPDCDYILFVIRWNIYIFVYRVIYIPCNNWPHHTSWFCTDSIFRSSLHEVLQPNYLHNSYSLPILSEVFRIFR
jgi:hypothetical protein